MSISLDALRKKIETAEDLNLVVSTMKAVATASITQYETAALSLGDYFRSVELGIAACLANAAFAPEKSQPANGHLSVTLVMGSDQGLVGQFNDRIARYAAELHGANVRGSEVWAVGTRVYERLENAGLHVARQFGVPNSVTAISRLIREILEAIEEGTEGVPVDGLTIVHYRPDVYRRFEAVSHRVLPLDAEWKSQYESLRWPNRKIPQVISTTELVFKELLTEYLFVAFFKAIAESLASENASRLSAMQRAEKNIEEIQQELNQAYNRMRQASIDAELFDIVSGFEALKTK